MATFIKPGFWIKAKKGFEHWLNLDELISQLSPSPSYKVYTALLTQSGTDAPVATVLENTIGNIVWSYDNVGSYIFSNSLFGIDYLKVIVLLGSTNSGGTIIRCGYYSGDSFWMSSYIRVITGTGIQSSNDALTDTPIEIRVYP